MRRAEVCCNYMTRKFRNTKKRSQATRKLPSVTALLTMQKLHMYYWYSCKRTQMYTNYTLPGVLTANYTFFFVAYYNWLINSTKSRKLALFIYTYFLWIYKDFSANTPFNMPAMHNTLNNRRDFLVLTNHTTHTISKGPMARKKWSREQYYSITPLYVCQTRLCYSPIDFYFTINCLLSVVKSRLTNFEQLHLKHWYLRYNYLFMQLLFFIHKSPSFSGAPILLTASARHATVFDTTGLQLKQATMRLVCRDNYFFF